MTQQTLTCTCEVRYVRDTDNSDHAPDCDLWLIDEFWAGFMSWDWDRECLFMSDHHPDRRSLTPPDDSEYEWDENDLLDKHNEVQEMLAEMDKRDQDIAITTDKFIERMLNKGPEDADDSWQKGNDGLWRKVEASGRTVVSNVGPTVTSAASSWGKYVSDRHNATKVHLPSGEVTVQATSACYQYDRETPDFGLYLDGSWKPDGLAIMLPWRDYGLPAVSNGFADYAIKEAYSWAVAGAVVEVGCIGAHGRTGVVLACMAVLDDAEMTGPEAVTFIRAMYCPHAIETREQEWWVERFHAEHHGLPVPEMPKPPVYVPKPVVVGPKAPSAGTSPTPSPAGGPSGKRNRRSKRGGKRQQRHQNRMNQGSRR